jgi:hypothetical protein
LVFWASNVLGTSPNARPPARSRERMKMWGIIEKLTAKVGEFTAGLRQH